MILMNTPLRKKIADEFIRTLGFSAQHSFQAVDPAGASYGHFVLVQLNNDDKPAWDDPECSLPNTMRHSAESYRNWYHHYRADRHGLDVGDDVSTSNAYEKPYISLFSTADIAELFTVTGSGSIEINVGEVLARISPYTLGGGDRSLTYANGEVPRFKTLTIYGYAFVDDAGDNFHTNQAWQTNYAGEDFSTINLRSVSSTALHTLYHEYIRTPPSYNRGMHTRYVTFALQLSIGEEGSGADIELKTTEDGFVHGFSTREETSVVDLKMPITLQRDRRLDVTPLDVFNTDNTRMYEITNADNWGVYDQQSVSDFSFADTENLVIFNGYFSAMHQISKGFITYFEIERPDLTHAALADIFGGTIPYQLNTRLTNNGSDYVVMQLNAHGGYPAPATFWSGVFTPTQWGARIGITLDWKRDPNQLYIILDDNNGQRYEWNRSMRETDPLQRTGYYYPNVTSISFCANGAGARLPIRFFFNQEDLLYLSDSAKLDPSIKTFDQIVTRKKERTTTDIRTALIATKSDYDLRNDYSGSLISRNGIEFPDDRTLALPRYNWAFFRPFDMSKTVYFEIEILPKSVMATLLGVDESRVDRRFDILVGSYPNWGRHAYAISYTAHKAQILCTKNLGTDYLDGTEPIRVSICLDLANVAGYVLINGQPVTDYASSTGQSWISHVRKISNYGQSPTPSDFGLGDSQLNRMDLVSGITDLAVYSNPTLEVVNRMNLGNPTQYSAIRFITDPADFLYPAPAGAVGLFDAVTAVK